MHAFSLGRMLGYKLYSTLCLVSYEYYGVGLSFLVPFKFEHLGSPVYLI
jgi:hypothetical protein